MDMNNLSFEYYGIQRIERETSILKRQLVTTGKLREKDGLLILYKGGEKHASIQLEQIKDKAKQYTQMCIRDRFDTVLFPVLPDMDEKRTLL